ncbi:MAG: extracellular solute-binding protein [Pseudomonadota bacterium]
MKDIWSMAAGIICLLMILGMILAPGRCPAAEAVVVYTSADQVYSEPVFEEFHRQTGIVVKPVYDVEASKTTGLVNRLIAETAKPRCDVFWNSEIGSMIVLKNKGVLDIYRSPSAAGILELFRDADGFWTGFGARARVLVYNTTLLKESDVPRSILELTDPKWRGRVAMAYPLFGTTATHVAALFCALGQQKAEAFLTGLNTNAVVIVNGNSVVRDLVAEGKLPLGITDTDDVNVARLQGRPVGMLYPDHDGLGTLLIPNTAALVRGAPHPDLARRFMDYLLSPETESRLAFSESAQMPLRKGAERPAHVPDPATVTPMRVDYGAVAEAMESAAGFCRNLFTR